MGRDTGTVEEETNGEGTPVTQIVTENQLILMKLDLILQELKKKGNLED